jgi:hypothetical protein
MWIVSELSGVLVVYAETDTSPRRHSGNVGGPPERSGDSYKAHNPGVLLYLMAAQPDESL